MALVATSVGKLSSRMETLTLRKALFPPPQLKVLRSALDLVHFCGRVQVISCWSHLTLWPPAIAADCAAVGDGPGAESALPLLDDDPEFEPESAAFLNRSARLQRDNPIAITT